MTTKPFIFLCFLLGPILISAVATEPSKDEAKVGAAQNVKADAAINGWGGGGPGGGWGGGEPGGGWGGGGPGGGWGGGGHGGGWGGGGHGGGWGGGGHGGGGWEGGGHEGGCYRCCGPRGCWCCPPEEANKGN